MLSDDNIRRINRQIEDQLRHLDLCPRDEEADVIKTIAALKALLEPQPSTEQIVRETLAALATVSEPKRSEPSVSDLLNRLFDR